MYFHDIMTQSRTVGNSPGVGRIIDQSGDAAKGSEKEACSAYHSAQSMENFLPSFSFIMMGSRGTFILRRLGSVTFKLFEAIDF